MQTGPASSEATLNNIKMAFQKIDPIVIDNDPVLRAPIASFEKVSFEEYAKARGCQTYKDREAVWKEWEAIQLPTRATAYSAGYDFHTPIPVCLTEDPTLIPTGIRVRMNYDWALILIPRSGLGFRYGVRLENTVGLIDADYYHADNEGHIMAKLSVNTPVHLEAGDRFMQGVFIPYGIAANEQASYQQRTGGFGSTGE